jgi:hypothetical protein
MNACTDSQYVVIDNCARIGLCDGGSLPALVSPPVDAGTDGGQTGDSGSDASGGDASDAGDSGDDSSADATPE